MNTRLSVHRLVGIARLRCSYRTGRDLTRFDLDYDLSDHLLPEFPAPIYLATRPVCSARSTR